MTAATPLEAARPWEYSAFEVTVARKRWITPRFVRITLAGPALTHFAPWGLDQRIKLVLPLPDGSIADFGLLEQPTPHPREWYARWKEMPAEHRNVLRTYTPAAIRPDAAEIDVDLYLHEPAGPASAWALACDPGDALVLTGPDARAGFTGYGIHYAPPAPPRHALLIGDESALPAIANIVRSRAGTGRTTVLLELADRADALLAGDDAAVTIVDRAGAPGSALTDAVRAWISTHGEDFARDGTAYAWIAGEAFATTDIRRHLTGDAGIPKDRVAFLGYWKRGGPLVG